MLRIVILSRSRYISNFLLIGSFSYVCFFLFFFYENDLRYLMIKFLLVAFLPSRCDKNGLLRFIPVVMFCRRYSR